MHPRFPFPILYIPYSKTNTPIWHHHQIEIGIDIKIKCLSAIWFSSKAHQTHYVAFRLAFNHISCCREVLFGKYLIDTI